ncbi:MAG: hypothetical protein ACM3JG_04485 [Thiohalocapsa sp.]
MADPRAQARDVKSSNVNVAYEAADWRIGVIGLVLLGIFLFLVIAPLALMWGFSHSLRDVDRGLTIQPPGPQLQINPPQDLANFRADEKWRLNTYYWIDKKNGVVHIPIEDAMRKLAHDGIPGFPKGNGQ